jgi:protocatechuate 3,4-dioxygenase beta subunit
MHNTSRRRHLLAALSALGAVPLVTRGLYVTSSSAAPSPIVTGKACVLSPAMTEGPFFVDERLDRSDLTAGTTRAGVVQGLPLILNIDVARVQASGCAPAASVQVDVWHADATGEYSDIAGGGVRSGAREQAYLRGYQLSDVNGRVTFRTIYPGQYSGRTIHVHVKARLFNATGNTTYEFTSQLFFDDSVNETVMATPPYNARGTRIVRNSQDGIYGNHASALVSLTPAAGSRGYVASALLGLSAGPARS